MKKKKRFESASFALVVTPGLESQALRELASWSTQMTQALVKAGFSGTTDPLRASSPNSGILEFDAPLFHGLLLNHALKVPTRILMRVAEFKCRDFPKLFQQMTLIDWKDFCVEDAPSWSVTASQSRVAVEKKIEQTCVKSFGQYWKNLQEKNIAQQHKKNKKQSKKDQNHIEDNLARQIDDLPGLVQDTKNNEIPNVDLATAAASKSKSTAPTHGAGSVSSLTNQNANPTPSQTIYVRIINDICTISIDTSGVALYKRGIRTHTDAAPLRESLAAGLLYSMIPDQFTNSSINKIVSPSRYANPLAPSSEKIELWDPMTGSGCFPLEAATLGRPIVWNHYPFYDWKICRERNIRKAKQSLSLLIGTNHFESCYGSDSSTKALTAARENLNNLLQQFDDKNMLQIHKQPIPSFFSEDFFAEDAKFPTQSDFQIRQISKEISQRKIAQEIGPETKELQKEASENSSKVASHRNHRHFHMILNPPYNARLSTGDAPQGFYQKILDRACGLIDAKRRISAPSPSCVAQTSSKPKGDALSDRSETDDVSIGTPPTITSGRIGLLIPRSHSRGLSPTAASWSEVDKIALKNGGIPVFFYIFESLR